MKILKPKLGILEVMLVCAAFAIAFGIREQVINYYEKYYRSGLYSTAISSDGERIAIELLDDYLTFFDSNLNQIGRMHIAETVAGLNHFYFDESDHNILYCEYEDITSNESIVSRIDFRNSSVKELWNSGEQDSLENYGLMEYQFSFNNGKVCFSYRYMDTSPKLKSVPLPITRKITRNDKSLSLIFSASNYVLVEDQSDEGINYWLVNLLTGNVEIVPSDFGMGAFSDYLSLSHDAKYLLLYPIDKFEGGPDVVLPYLANRKTGQTHELGIITKAPLGFADYKNLMAIGDSERDGIRIFDCEKLQDHSFVASNSWDANFFPGGDKLLTIAAQKSVLFNREPPIIEIWDVNSGELLKRNQIQSVETRNVAWLLVIAFFISLMFGLQITRGRIRSHQPSKFRVIAGYSFRCSLLIGGVAILVIAFWFLFEDSDIESWGFWGIGFGLLMLGMILVCCSATRLRTTLAAAK